MQPIVLASSSVYRRETLKKLHLDFICATSGIDENPQENEAPAALAVRLAIAKAQSIAKNYPHHFIIGSDQVAACGDIRLGKPGNRENAIYQLQIQSGQKVTFYTGICVFNSNTGESLTDLDVCDVHFRKLDAQQIERYVDKEQPFDYAGSFKSEGYGIVLFDRIEGDDPNALVGLPLIKLVRMLNQCSVLLP